MKSFVEHTQQRLLEASLARLQQHLNAGKSLGIVSATTGDRDKAGNEDAHKQMIKRFREHGYGPIQATGRSQWGVERSIIVPGASKEHLEKIGNEFHQQAVIHVPAGGKKEANLHWLKAGGENAGKVEPIGKAHMNKPNSNGVTVLKGLGYNTKDGKTPTRSFSFESIDPECVIESLVIPRGGILNSLETPA